MRVLAVLAGLAALLLLLLAGGAGWLLTLPPPRAEPAAVGDDERRATLAALRPPKRARADVAEVVALATEPGPVRLYPALAVEPDATTAEFDAAPTT
jgi:hypothetical protein